MGQEVGKKKWKNPCISKGSCRSGYVMFSRYIDVNMYVLYNRWRAIPWFHQFISVLMSLDTKHSSLWELWQGGPDEPTRIVECHISTNMQVLWRMSTPSCYTKLFYRDMDWGDGGPFIINPIYTLYHMSIYWVYPLLKGFLGLSNSQGPSIPRALEREIEIKRGTSRYLGSHEAHRGKLYSKCTNYHPADEAEKQRCLAKTPKMSLWRDPYRDGAGRYPSSQ